MIRGCAPGSPVENRKIFTATASTVRKFGVRAPKSTPASPEATPTSVGPAARKGATIAKLVRDPHRRTGHGPHVGPSPGSFGALFTQWTGGSRPHFVCFWPAPSGAGVRRLRVPTAESRAHRDRREAVPRGRRNGRLNVTPQGATRKGARRETGERQGNLT